MCPWGCPRAAGHGIVLGECPAALPDPLPGARFPADRRDPGLCPGAAPARDNYANDPHSPLGRVPIDELFAGVQDLWR